MELRPARAEDADAVTALVERSFARYVPRIGQRPSPMDADHAASIAAGRVVVAVEPSGLAGVVVLTDHPDHVEVAIVAVDPDRQGAGVGRALLAHAEAHARGRGTPLLRLQTNARMTENLEIYPRLGFREEARRTERGFARVWFTKPLQD